MISFFECIENAQFTERQFACCARNFNVSLFCRHHRMQAKRTKKLSALIVIDNVYTLFVWLHELFYFICRDCYSIPICHITRAQLPIIMTKWIIWFFCWFTFSFSINPNKKKILLIRIKMILWTEGQRSCSIVAVDANFVRQSHRSVPIYK